MEKENLTNQINELEAQLKPLREKLNEVLRRQEEETDLKIKRCLLNQDKFNDDELTYAADARCDCGAGFAYANTTGVRGSWYCSDILTGRAIPGNMEGAKNHASKMSFIFHEIKSENQPRANGRTTRPTL